MAATHRDLCRGGGRRSAETGDFLAAKSSTEIAISANVVTTRVILPIFLAAQAFDGLFTYVAVQSYGLIAEGNVLLATWIGLVGPGPAILGAKILAASCGVLLYCLGVHRALLGLTVLYGAFAIVPWLIVLQRA